MRAVLIVLDGFGIGKDSPFNAIQNARMPFYRELVAKYPHSQLLTHGGAVGLPDGVMGNSEVGHMTMGAGRILYQDLTRIERGIRDRTFFANVELRGAMEAAAKAGGRPHLMGLLSDGGVHSHLDHLLALLDLAAELKIPEVVVHPFLDGRDTPPDSAVGYLERLLGHPAFSGTAATRAILGSVSGRYYAMDRDQRWERVARAHAALLGEGPSAPGALAAIAASHAAGKSDEFVEPVTLDPRGALLDGDAVIFFNFRSDRARELTAALTEPEFAGFVRPRFPRLAAFCGMTQYDAKLARARVAFPPQSLENLFGAWLEARGLPQLRIAETEKYAHVTFFFNGGREAPYAGEDRVLIPSPKDVATYDLKPEMSADAVAAEAARRIAGGQYAFTLLNFANADMVAHSGKYEPTVRAIEALDRCLAQVVGAAEKAGCHTLITADHGNAEEMCDDEGRPHTQHTLNPVPAVWVAPGSAGAPKTSRLRLSDGGLADLYPTLAELMGLPLPPEVTGRSLLPKDWRTTA